MGANFKWKKARYLSYWYKECSDYQTWKQLLLWTGMLSVFFFVEQYSMSLFFYIFINMQLCHICVVWAIKSKLSYQTSGPIKLILGEDGLRSGSCSSDQVQPVDTGQPSSFSKSTETWIISWAYESTDSSLGLRVNSQVVSSQIITWKSQMVLVYFDCLDSLIICF